MDTKGLFLICLLITRGCAEKLCDSIPSNRVAGVQWPTTGTRSISEPPCLNSAKEFAYRACENGIWASEPQCTKLQREMPVCPDNFKQFGNICYHVTEKDSWMPKCPFVDNLFFFEYMQAVDEKELGPVWLPARRDPDSGLNTVVWTEPSHLYKQEVKIDQLSDPNKDKNCLVFYNSSLVVPVVCHKQYPTVCAYYTLDELVNSLCFSMGTCSQSDYMDKSKCFCVEEVTHQAAADLVKPYQYQVYQKLSNEVCTIGLRRTKNGTYLWTGTGKEIEYTNWSDEVNFGGAHSYGAITPNGWILTDQKQNCTLCERVVQMVELTIILIYNDSMNLLVANISHPQYLKGDNYNGLVYCFDSGIRILAHQIELNQSNRGPYLFEFLPPHPGLYHCEAFNILDSTLIKSQVVDVTAQHLHVQEFVATLRLQYKNVQNPFSSDLANFIAKNLQEHVNLTQYFNYTFRITKVVDVNQDGRYAMVYVHYTINKTNVQLSKVHSLIDNCFDDWQEYKFQLVDLLSVDFCDNVSDPLTWPRTFANEDAISVEYCFNSDGFRAWRRCQGSFDSGAKWVNSPVCDVAPLTTRSRELNSLVESSDLHVFSQVLNISEEYKDFTPLDVYLVGLIYAPYRNIVNCELFMETMDNLMKIDKNVLAKSQLKMLATDRLLSMLSHALSTPPSNKQYNYTNVVFLSASFQDLSGIALTKVESKLTWIALTGNYVVEDIVDMEHLEFAIWLSPELRSQMYLADQVILGFFYDSSFFYDPVTPMRTVNQVFSVMLPHQDSLKAPVYVLHRTNKTTPEDCYSWSWGVGNRGHWQFSPAQTLSSSFTLCQFRESGFFGFNAASPNQNSVTSTLMSMLSSQQNYMVPMSISRPIVNISERYAEFKSVDVYLLGEVLQQMSANDDLDLSGLTKVVSNLHKIDREVLFESQVQEGATDTVLHYVDVILQKQKNRTQMEVKDDNFLVVISDLVADDFTGFTLHYQNGTFDSNLLTGDVTLADLEELDTLHCALLLSPELKNQITSNARGPEDTKVVVAVFWNDALFNEESQKLVKVSKTFGVLLPIVDNFAGPVSLVHRNTMEQAQKCVHWHYDRRSNVTGSWQEDQDVQDGSSLVHCEYWHTTHFALLLLDHDRVDDPSSLLDVITAVNCAISALSLSIIMFTGVIFEKWRASTSNQILLNFSFAILLQIIMLYVSSTIDLTKRALCTSFGAILHFSVLSQFYWMLVLGVLQFRRFVHVLIESPRFVLIKGIFVGWVLPLFPVVILLIVDPGSYVSGVAGLCYPSGWGLYVGVWLPVGVSIVGNLGMFICIMYSVSFRNTDCANIGSPEAILQWRLGFSLFFMLGLTWIFGFIGELHSGDFFVYVFCFTATLQGFIVFLFFFLFNANTRDLYSNAMSKLYNFKRF